LCYNAREHRKGNITGLVKVKEVNLERGYPARDMALREMVNQLQTCKRMGCRAVVLIHGYGSTGTGGLIRTAVRAKLKEPSLSGLVRKYCGGEDWINSKKEMLDFCNQLKDYETRISGNPGVTVVILK